MEKLTDKQTKLIHRGAIPSFTTGSPQFNVPSIYSDDKRTYGPLVRRGYMEVVGGALRSTEAGLKAAGLSEKAAVAFILFFLWQLNQPKHKDATYHLDLSKASR